MRKLDLTGQKFGMLTAVKPVGIKKGSGNVIWLFHCDCSSNVKRIGSVISTGKMANCGCVLALPAGEAAFNTLFKQYQRSAKDCNRTFELTKEQFRTFTQGNCWYCGIKPSTFVKPGRMKGGYLYNGLDRMDSKRGYVLGNVVSCCQTCNIAKHTMTQDEFRNWITKVYKHWVEVPEYA